MQKTLKKTFALILAVMLCLGVMPLSVFASENHSAEEITSEAASSEPLSESGITDTVTNPEEPFPNETAQSGPKEAVGESAEMMEPDPEPTDEPNSPYETELTQMDAQQIWPALQRAKARAAAGVGASGVLQMGYYCFKSDVGTLTTLGEYVSQMPAKTMLINGTNVAAVCSQHC